MIPYHFKYYVGLLLLGLVISFGLSVNSVNAKSSDPQEPEVRVGLLKGISQVEVGSLTDYRIVDGETGKVLKKKAQTTYKAEISNQNVIIAGVEAKRIRLIPGKKDQIFQVSGQKYRGEIELLNQRGTLTVVNIIGLEKYLYGVLPAEMSPSWNFEALKAQAVAARSYALNTKGKHQKDGYDVCATTDCQVYKGYDGEHKTSNQAIDATRGEVLTYQGKVILAAFHAAGGGYTENSENVWNSTIPYLRGVEDFDQESSHYQWKIEMNAELFLRKLKNINPAIGEVQSLSLSPLEKSPQKSPDRGVSGRVLKIALVGKKGTVDYTGSELRSLLGLKSTRFDIFIQKDEKSKKVQVNKAKKEWRNLKKATITIEGYGWGHGLGMSQWGAKSYADQNKKEKDFYKKILEHYYSGTTLEKEYE